jgi:hypothetical protein
MQAGEVIHVDTSIFIVVVVVVVDIRPCIGVEAGKKVVSSLRYAFSEFVHGHLLDHR